MKWSSEAWNGTALVGLTSISDVNNTNNTAAQEETIILMACTIAKLFIIPFWGETMYHFQKLRSF